MSVCESRITTVVVAMMTFTHVAYAQDYNVTTTDLSPALSTSDAASEVDRQTMDERLPRSSPDALRYEPGVFVQQTAHGQGSAYIRGLCMCHTFAWANHIGVAWRAASGCADVHNTTCRCGGTSERHSWVAQRHRQMNARRGSHAKGLI